MNNRDRYKQTFSKLHALSPITFGEPEKKRHCRFRLVTAFTAVIGVLFIISLVTYAFTGKTPRDFLADFFESAPASVEDSVSQNYRQGMGQTFTDGPWEITLVGYYYISGTDVLLAQLQVKGIEDVRVSAFDYARHLRFSMDQVHGKGDEERRTLGRIALEQPVPFPIEPIAFPITQIPGGLDMTITAMNLSARFEEAWPDAICDVEIGMTDGTVYHLYHQDEEIMDEMDIMSGQSKDYSGSITTEFDILLDTEQIQTVKVNQTVVYSR